MRNIFEVKIQEIFSCGPKPLTSGVHLADFSSVLGLRSITTFYKLYAAVQSE